MVKIAKSLLCIQQCVLCTVTWIVRILKAPLKDSPERLSLVPDCCPHVCPQRGGCQQAIAPVFPSRDP